MAFNIKKQDRYNYGQDKSPAVIEAEEKKTKSKKNRQRQKKIGTAVHGKREGVLLHACCAPCATHVIEVLSRTCSVSVLFYNPNIQPEEEYVRRLQSMQKLCDLTQTELFVLQDNINLWGSRVQGLETDPEGGRRCGLCFEIRLGKAAEFAIQQGFDAFTTTLTVSPHKSSQCIQAIGNQVALSAGIRFLAEDFKLEDGYRRSCLLSREYGLYRQKYCGCRFSLRQQDNEASKRS